MKYVIETVQIVKRKYYVQVEDPTWACDSIVMQELEPFSHQEFSEDVINIIPVTEDDFPKPTIDENVNACTQIFDYARQVWDRVVRWDLKK